MIDYSNGYPVQVTTNVTKNTPWKDVINQNPSIVKTFTDWSSDGWYPKNYKNVCDDPHCEAYKEVLLKLKYHGHIPSDTKSYYEVLKKFETKYNRSKNFRKKIDDYIEMTNDLWNKPTNKITFKKSNYFIPISERTEFGKQYYKLENELISEFSKI